MRNGFSLRAALTLASTLIPVAGLVAQGGGGFGFGGRGTGGGINPFNAPLPSDLTGPYAYDSVSTLLTLTPEQLSQLEAVRAAYVTKTQALRDTLLMSAKAAGYTINGETNTPATDAAGMKLAKNYDKYLNKLREIDSDFYYKQVKPLLNKSQWNAYFTWLGEKAQSGRGGRGGGRRGGGGYYDN